MGTAAVLPMVVSFLALTRIVAVKDNTYRSSLSCARRSHIGGTMMEARPLLHSPCQSTSTPYYYGYVATSRPRKLSLLGKLLAVGAGSGAVSGTPHYCGASGVPSSIRGEKLELQLQ